MTFFYYSDIDLEAQFSLNQTRAEDITLREDYGSLQLVPPEDGFGDMVFDSESPDIMREALSTDQSLEQVIYLAFNLEFAQRIDFCYCVVVFYYLLLSFMFIFDCLCLCNFVLRINVFSQSNLLFTDGVNIGGDMDRTKEPLPSTSRSIQEPSIDTQTHENAFGNSMTEEFGRKL